MLPQPRSRPLLTVACSVLLLAAACVPARPDRADAPISTPGNATPAAAPQERVTPAAVSTDAAQTSATQAPGGVGTPAGAAAEPTAGQGSAAPAGPVMNDATLAVRAVGSGVIQPTSLAFLGPDDFLVTEKATGKVRRVRDTAVGDTVLDLAVNSFDERGLLGITLHPQFGQNGFVYLYWTWRGGGDGPQQLLGGDSDQAKEVPELGNRVDRFRWDGSKLTWDRNIIMLRSNTLETDTTGRVRGNHDAGPIAFGPDGKLYAMLGDQNLRGQLQNIQDGPPPDNRNFSGMIVRLNDDGTVPADNPFYEQGGRMGGEAGLNVQKIFAYGVRNSYGLAFERRSGSLWMSENGDDSYDEINVFRPGDNSGWIQFMGPPERLADWKQIEVGTKDGLDNPAHPPDRIANGADEAQQRLFSLEGSRLAPPVFSWKFPVAVTSIGFVGDDALGSGSANTLFAGTVLTDSLYRFPVSEDGMGLALDGALKDKVDDNAAKGDLGESRDFVVGTGFGIVTHVEQGPDGALYVLSLSNGSIYQVTASTAEASANATPSGAVAAAATPGGAAAQPRATPGLAAGSATQVTVGTDTGTQNLFIPDAITVKESQPVVLTYQNLSTQPHNLTFPPPLDVKTKVIVPPGGSETLKFVAPSAGSYQFVCTIHPGMVGTMTSEP